MCGIIGYVGSKSAQPILTAGLRRLEYRGYDSAGIVTINHLNQATLLRAKGKVSQLEKLVSSHKNTDPVGIGHTRWATHGQPSKHNSHPHQSGDIYLVHNGIIENYKDLKANLHKHKFTSETDTEVLAALIDSFYTQQTPLLEAVTKALQLVVGTYGIAVLSTRQPNEIIVARKGSPLIIGVGKKETIITSDAAAIVGYTKKAIYLNDGEIARCTRDGADLYDLSSRVLPPHIEEIAIDEQNIQKQGYKHFLLKEIMEQPTTLQATIGGRVIPDKHQIKLGGLNLTTDQLKSIKHIVIIGCGTAYYAGLQASYYLEQLAGDVTISVEIASELRYRSFNLPPGSVALIVSQSGETADTLACLREIKQRGVPVLGIVNVVGSTIAREVDGGIYVHVGPEISVASTKAFTSQVAALTIFGLQLAKIKGSSTELINKFIKELSLLPNEIESIIKKHQSDIKKIAKKYYQYDNALYLGRDTLYPTALEGALKLKEVSYIHAEGYAAGELKHGPISLIDQRFFEVILIEDNWLLEKSISNLAEISARSGHVIAITNATSKIDAETVLYIKTRLSKLTPILFNVLQQLLAYYIAVERGTDVDQPRNLAKSVTVE